MSYIARVALVIALALLPMRAALPAPEPLEIPTVLPLTGPAAFVGKEYAETMRLMEDRINRAGGVGGRPIHFAISDDESNPQVDVQLTTAELAKKPAVIIDGAPLALCRASQPLVQNGPLMYCLSPSAHPEGYLFAVMAATRDSFVAALTYFRDRGLKKVAILNGTDATGSDSDAMLADVIKLPQFAGMSYVAQEHFNPTDLSVAAQVARIKASGAQALIASTTGTPVATVLRGLSDAGMNLPVFTSQGNMSVAQLDGYKSFVPKELLFPGYSALAPDAIFDGGVRDKVSEFRTTMTGANLSIDLLHATPWDPVALIVEAYKRAGPNATSPQLRDALNGVRNWPGIFGRYDFPAVPGRGLGVNWIVVSKWEPDKSTWVAVSKPGGAALK